MKNSKLISFSPTFLHRVKRNIFAFILQVYNYTYYDLSLSFRGYFFLQASEFRNFENNVGVCILFMCM